MFITTDLEGFSFLFTFVSANNFIWYMIKKQKQIVAHVAPASSYILLRRKKKVGAKAGYSSYCNTDDSNYFTMFERKRKYLPDVFFFFFFSLRFSDTKTFLNFMKWWYGLFSTPNSLPVHDRSTFMAFFFPVASFTSVWFKHNIMPTL